METRIAFVTIPRGEARRFAKALLESRLAACVNILDIGSLYWWEGRVEEDEEALLIIKTQAKHTEQLEKFILEEHPYQVPEYIVLEPKHVYSKYSKWVVESTSLTGEE